MPTNRVQFEGFALSVNGFWGADDLEATTMVGIAPDCGFREGLGATERGRVGMNASPFFSGFSVLWGTEGVGILPAASVGVKGVALAAFGMEAPERGCLDCGKRFTEASANMTCE